jgi:hypothetical protein
VPVDRVTGEPFAFEHAGESLVLRATPLREATLDGEDPFELGYEWRLPVR